MPWKRIGLMALLGGLVAVLLVSTLLANLFQGTPPPLVPTPAVVALPTLVSKGAVASPTPMPLTATPVPSGAGPATATVTPSPQKTETRLPVVATQPVTLSVRAKIDGLSRLVVKGNTVYWLHQEWIAPGRSEERDEPTLLNGVAWYPEWKDTPNRQNLSCKCQSSSFEGVPILASLAQTVTVSAQVRGGVAILQQPDASNQYTLIVQFDDGLPPRADWYEVTLTYLTRRP